MPKERNFNPVQAQRKADKAKAIKKGKAEVQSRRNEKLAQRNPQRIQQQIDDLKAIAQGGGKLSKQEEQALEALEKDLKAVQKAREALGDRAPVFGGDGPRRDGQGRGGVLGKRRRDGEDGSSSDSDVPGDVRNIPMPRDTPPPIPKEELDKWYAKRRERRDADRDRRDANRDRRDANQEPLGRRERSGKSQTPAPVVEAKTVYEAKPVLRDLRKEAVSAFVPTAVRMKVDKAKGQGGLLEPEEADRLESEGYLNTHAEGGQAEATAPEKQKTEEHGGALRTVTMEEVEDEEG